MFLGPFEEGGDYRDEGIQGPWGFLHRLFDTVAGAVDGAPDPDVERKLHRTIKQLTEQVGDLQYNTSIAALMEYLNAVRAGGRRATRAEVEPLVPMIAPFCPHIAEELWERLGHQESVFNGANWPAWDEAKAREDRLAIAVQVNGKLRATVTAARDAPREAVEGLARSDENVARHLEGAEVVRIVYVPERLVNFVVRAAATATS
jgi:leucyl-tRNA synthetase